MSAAGDRRKVRRRLKTSKIKETRRQHLAGAGEAGFRPDNVCKLKHEHTENC